MTIPRSSVFVVVDLGRVKFSPGGIGFSGEWPNISGAPLSPSPQYTSTIVPWGFLSDSVPGIPTNLAPTGICLYIVSRNKIQFISKACLTIHLEFLVIMWFCKDKELTCIEVPDVRLRVTSFSSVAAFSISSCLATFRKTSSRVARPSWMSVIPNSLCLSWTSPKVLWFTQKHELGSE